MSEHNYNAGDVVYRDRYRPAGDPMNLYRFDSWSDVPAHIHAGRIANLTWLWNGTPSGAWEHDMAPAPIDMRSAQRAVVIGRAKAGHDRERAGRIADRDGVIGS